METQERDWIADWNLDDWQQLDAAARQAWIEDNLWRDPVDDELDRDAARRRDDRLWRQESAARQSYRLGRTVWDIGLQPQPFTVGMAQAIDKIKPEHGDGIVFWNPELRTRVLSALLANAGVRRAVQLIPPGLLREQVERDEQHAPRPVTRPEFVMSRLAITTPPTGAPVCVWTLGFRQVPTTGDICPCTTYNWTTSR